MFSKTTALVTAIAMTVLINTSVQAEHEHNARYHRLDDLAFSAFIDARELRWEIHDDFVDSHDYDHLLEDADKIIASMQEVQAAIYRERPDEIIARLIDVTFSNMSNLTSHLNGCDFAQVRRGSHRVTYGGRGYSYTPETAHVGRIHVDAALRSIAKIETALALLEREVRPGHHHDHHDAIRGLPSPSPAVVPQPRPVIPPRPVGYSRNGAIEIPLGSHHDSRFVFRVGF